MKKYQITFCAPSNDELKFIAAAIAEGTSPKQARTKVFCITSP